MTTIAENFPFPLYGDLTDDTNTSEFRGCGKLGWAFRSLQSASRFSCQSRVSLPCNKNSSCSSGWTPGRTPRRNYVDKDGREQRYCCHYFWSDLTDDEIQTIKTRLYRMRCCTCCTGHLLIQHDGGHLLYLFHSSVINIGLMTEGVLWMDHEKSH